MGRTVGRATHVLGQIVLARLLAPEAFGLYAIGWTILRIVGLISLLGLDHGIIRYGSPCWNTDSSRFKGVLFQAVGLTLLSGLLFGGALVAAAPWLAEQVFQNSELTFVLRWFGLAVSLVAGLKVVAAATRVSQRMQYSVYSEELIQPTANLLLIVTFYLLGWKLLGAVVAVVASFSIAFILALCYTRHLFPAVFSRRVTFDFPVSKLFWFSLPVSFASIFVVLVTRIDVLMVGYFLPGVEVGVYQAASQSSLLFAVILSGFGTIFSPMIADLYQKTEMDRLQELFRVSTKWALYMSLPLFLMICFFSEEVMILLFGSEYKSGGLPLLVLSVGQLINAGTGAVGLLLLMTGHQVRWLLISSSMVVTDILLNWVLIPTLGVVGAALGTTCAVGGLFFLALFQVKRSLGIWPYDIRYFKGFLAGGLIIGVLLLVRILLMIPQNPYHLFLVCLMSYIIFGSTLIVLGLDNEDLQFLRLLRGRLK